MNSKNTTIVSSFFTNINNRNDRKFDDYINYGKFLLMTNISKVIFTDKDTYEIIKPFENENTTILIVEKTDIYLYEYLDKLTDFNIITTFKEKDTIEYMFTMCSKTEWVKKAIHLDIYKTENYIWVDFGIKHVFKCSDEEFLNKISNLNNKTYNSIRIASIWDLNRNYNIDIYKNIAWYFAGGVFGGNKKSQLQFANLMKQYCLEIMKETKTLMWEVNIWYLIYSDIPDLFSCYYCNHNDSIIDDY